jgi:hypothetical protein
MSKRVIATLARSPVSLHAFASSGRDPPSAPPPDDAVTLMDMLEDLLGAHSVDEIHHQAGWAVQLPRPRISVTSLIASDLAALTPCRRENVLRFGHYTVDQLHIPPPFYNATLRTVEDVDAETATQW